MTRVDPATEALGGEAAPPRDNGELVFQAPWEARAFALAVAVVEQLDLPWDEFRQRLIIEISADPDRPYCESWAAALESFILAHDLADPDAIVAATPAQRPTL